MRTDGIAEVVAGGGSSTAEGVAATSARVSSPTDVAALPGDAFLFVENGAHRVRKVDDEGVVTTVAGDGSLSNAGDGGPATAAGLYYPWSVAVMPGGGFVVSQPYSYLVRRVMPDGTIKRILGDGKGHYPDNVPGTESGSNYPFGLAVMKDESVLVAEDFGARVRRVLPNGFVVPFAGTGTGTDMGHELPAGGYDGDPATSVGLGRVCDVAVAPDGSVLIAQADCSELHVANNRYYLIGRVTTDGRYSVYAGNGVAPHYDIAGKHRRQASLGRLRGLAVTSGGDPLYVENSYYRAYSIDGDLVLPPDPDPDPDPDPGGGDPPAGDPAGPPPPPGPGPKGKGASADTIAVLSRRMVARSGSLLRVRVRSQVAGIARIELLQGKRRADVFERRLRRGTTTIRLRAPRRTGRYTLRIELEDGSPVTATLRVIS